MQNENHPTNLPTMLPATTAPKSSPADRVRKVVALTKLRSHFYQPGQTEAQIKGVIDDMLADLDHISPYEVEDACVAYRRDPANKFFPTPGQLIGATKEKPAVARSSLKHYDPKEFKHHNPVPPGQLKAPYLILMEHRGMSYDAAMAAQNRMFPNGFPPNIAAR